MYRRIDMGSHAPVFTKPRKLSTEKYNAAQAEFKNLESNGISLLRTVRKIGQKKRRYLNSITKIDSYPIPNFNFFQTSQQNSLYKN